MNNIFSLQKETITNDVQLKAQLFGIILYKTSSHVS